MTHSNVVNMDGTSYVPQKNSTQVLIADIETLISTDPHKLLGKTNEKQEYANAEKRVNDFLAQTNIRANLLTGDYETGLKLVAPLFFGANNTMQEVPYLGILIALLARLKSQSHNKKVLHRADPKQEQLEEFVDAFIVKGGSSPSDAISIIAAHMGTTPEKSQIEKTA